MRWLTMSHLIKIYTVCPLVFEFSILYGLDSAFFEILQMKILLSLFLVVIVKQEGMPIHFKK